MILDFMSWSLTQLNHGSLVPIEETQNLFTELNSVHKSGELTHGQDNRSHRDPQMFGNLGHLLHILKDVGEILIFLKLEEHLL